MNIENILESFNLDPLRKYESLEFIYEDMTPAVMDAITEASTGTTKKNILQKLWNLLMRFFNWIKQGLQILASFIKKVFSRKVKSADQCITSVGLTPIERSKISSIPNTTLISAGDKSEQLAPKEVSVKQSIKSDDGTISEDNLIVPIKDMILQFQDTDSSIKIKVLTPSSPDIKISDGNELASSFNNLNTVKGHRILSTHGAALGLLFIKKLVKDRSIVDDIITIAHDIEQRNFENGAFSEKVLKEKIDKIASIWIEGNKELTTEYTLTIQEIDMVTQIITQLNDAIQKTGIGLNHIDKDFSTDKGIVDYVNTVNTLALLMQFAINNITSEMHNIYKIDASYIGSAKSTEQLSKCIEQMIKGSLPSKYVAYNTYLLAAPEMKKFSSELNPSMGQSRCVLYPTDEKIVYKFAINSAGITGIKQDKFVYDTYKKIGREELLPELISTEYNFCLSTNQRVKTNSEQKNRNHNNAVAKVRNDVELLKQKAGFAIGDLHEDNIGYAYNHPVIMDYGNIYK